MDYDSEELFYGHKDGMALTMTWFKAPRPNGGCVVMILSGGWHSWWADAQFMPLPYYEPFVSKGFHTFVVSHGSAPRYVLPEIVEDIRRSIRFIRFSKDRFGIDPERIGVTGASAGGHLTLVLATTADEGDPKSPDPVLQESDRIAAAVAYCPPTDIRTWTQGLPPGLEEHQMLNAPLKFDPALEGSFSPLLHVSSATPPTLLIHGDKDTLIPPFHSEKMIVALREARVPSELIVLQGAGHSFEGKDAEAATKAKAEWFVKYLS